MAAPADHSQELSAPGPAPAKDMVWIPGGTYLMGSAVPDYPEEHPQHRVSVDGFWIDLTPVTVARFRRFVRATGYLTVAERAPDPAQYPNLDPAVLVPGSLVFTPTLGPVDLNRWQTWWRYVPGADWAHPEGPGSSAGGRDLHPVTQVAWEDVAAYADWAGKQIPTEAEWEYAARGGLDGATYAWGEEFSPRGRPMANTWIGEFPWESLKPVGKQRTSPVRSFPPNGYGMFDVTGNVWEWTSDFYRSSHADSAELPRLSSADAAGATASVHSCCGPGSVAAVLTVSNPAVSDPAGSHDPDEPGGAHLPRRVIKGGSHLCAANYCRRYRPAGRQAQQVDSSMSHLGFRCVIRPSGPH
jgi:formylglycine-generating enzyme required for sulfatase activity